MPLLLLLLLLLRLVVTGLTEDPGLCICFIFDAMERTRKGGGGTTALVWLGTLFI